MLHKKTISALLISIVTSLSAPAFAQQGGTEDHSAHHPEGGKTKPPPNAKRSGKGTKGGMAEMGSCPMHDDMMGSMSQADRQAMMERRIKSMTPEMRKKRLAMMEKHMQMMQDQMQMMRDHMNDPVTPDAGDSGHGHQK